MANRLYVVPVVGAGTDADRRRPKYFRDVIAGAYGAMDYGVEPWMVVGADLSASDHALLASQVDVQALPLDLTATLTGGQVTATKAFLEAANLPAGWVTTALTWAAVVRTVLGVFSFVQRFGAIYAAATGSPPPSLFSGGVTLDSTFGSLPLAVRTALADTADDQGISTAGITGGTTVRVLLKTMADAYEDRPLSINGLVI